MPLLLALLALAFGALSCDRRPTPGAAQLVNAAYVEVVSLSAQSDQTHRIAIDGPSGSTWYRDPVGGLDLSQCNYRGAFVAKGPVDTVWAVVIPLSGAADNVRFNGWLREQEGKDIGIVLGGQLVVVVRGSTMVHDYIWITAFGSEEDAAREAEIIRAGAVEPGEHP